MISYSKPDADGWRYSTRLRTRKENIPGYAGNSWRVERWNGEAWEFLRWASGYAGARSQ